VPVLRCKLQIVEDGSDLASVFAMCNPVDPSSVFGICGRHPPSLFADSDALKLAVGNCLAVDPTGENCCSRTDFLADCEAAGTADMPGWDTSAVTSMSVVPAAPQSASESVRERQFSLVGSTARQLATASFRASESANGEGG